MRKNWQIRAEAWFLELKKTSMILKLANRSYSFEERSDCGWPILALYHYSIISLRFRPSTNTHVTMTLSTNMRRLYSDFDKSFFNVTYHLSIVIWLSIVTTNIAHVRFNKYEFNFYILLSYAEDRLKTVRNLHI